MLTIKKQIDLKAQWKNSPQTEPKGKVRNRKERNEEYKKGNYTKEKGKTRMFFPLTNLVQIPAPRLKTSDESEALHEDRCNVLRSYP